jgi:hypothetical protein
MDACGTDTAIGEDMARQRTERAGVWLTSTDMMVTELVQDWNTPKGIPLVRAMTGGRRCCQSNGLRREHHAASGHYRRLPQRDGYCKRQPGCTIGLVATPSFTNGWLRSTAPRLQLSPIV